MRASRQSNFAARRARRGVRAFTLIELIFVLALLAISALFVTSSLGGFFRGRALNFEARRMLSLAQYGQSRAVSEGVPVILWVNPATSTYGLTVQSSYNDPLGDVHAVRYTAESSLKLETPANATPAISEQDDERLGIDEGLAFIRFTPDGFFDDTSAERIIIRLGTSGTGLVLVPTASHLGYEIRPLTNNG
jgi:prepilin-type N-terminal cleavage/methylation domain-containing protein